MGRTPGVGGGLDRCSLGGLASEAMRRILFLCGWVALASPAGGQTWPDKNTATPDLVQTGFGPNGAYLPFDGSAYCGPTAASMALGYLNAAGFTQLIGASPTDADYLNLVRVLSGLGGASDSGGTLASSLLDGVGIYMDAKGIAPAKRSIPSGNGGYHQTLGDIQSQNVDQHILFGALGWYVDQGGVYTRYGGHFFVITDQTVGASGTLTIHNPYPNSLLDQPNIPANVQQTIAMADFLATSTNNNYPLPVGTYLQFVPGQQNIGPNAYYQAVLEQVFRLSIDASELPSAGFTPKDWQVASTTTINTGGGILDVTTKVTGTGGFRKVNQGEMVFHREVALSGDHTVEAGALVSRVGSGDAFGTGSVALTGTGGLAFRPDDAAPASVALGLASRPHEPGGDGAQVSFAGGNAIDLDRGANPSLLVTLGGNNGNGVANLVQATPQATLVIRADDLGGTERLVVTGSGANLPVLTNGIVGGNIVGASGAALAGSFLTYNTTNGLLPAAAFTGDINLSTSSTIYRATNAQTLTENAEAFAVTLEGVTLGGAFALGVGGGPGPAGMIFNGGSVATETLTFGPAQATVYAGTSGGLIAADITGSAGLVKFGSGTLAVTGSAAGLAGNTYVQTGTLAVGGVWGLTSATTEVLAGGTLQVNAVGSVSGTTKALADATVSLQGGRLANVEILSTSNSQGPIQGATLQGAGTITGALSLNGYIAADPVTKAGTLTIEGLVTTDTGAAFIWSLPALVDNVSGLAGTDWNNIILTNHDATFGTWDVNAVDVLFDFGAGLDPDSGNAFWTQDHEWTVLTFSGRTNASQRASLSFPASAFPAGTFGYRHQGNETLLIFTAVPEPSTWALLLLAGFGTLLLWRPGVNG